MRRPGIAQRRFGCTRSAVSCFETSSGRSRRQRLPASSSISCDRNSETRRALPARPALPAFPAPPALPALLAPAIHHTPDLSLIAVADVQRAVRPLRDAVGPIRRIGGISQRLGLSGEALG